MEKYHFSTKETEVFSYIPGRVIGMETDEREIIIQRLKEGLSSQSIDDLQKAFGITLQELSALINIPSRTIGRRKEQGRLASDESERVYRIAKLYDFALSFMRDEESVKSWFKSPALAFGGKTPLQYCDTEIGSHAVEDLLGQIAHGVFP